MDEATKKAMDALNSSIGISEAMKAMEKMSSTLSSLSINSLSLPRMSIPEFHAPRLPTIPVPPNEEEINEFQSSGALMRRLADTILLWRKQLPEDQQPAILAIMYGGIQVAVERLAQEGFHGIRIEGRLNGNPCMLLAHQSTVQLLCYVEKVEKKEFRRKIGFIIDGEEKEL